GPMTLRQGPRGPFFGCARYPRCRGSRTMPHCGIVADVRATLEMLLPLLPSAPREPWTTIPPNPEPSRLPGLDIVAPLRKLLPPDGIVSADVTRLAYILMLDFPLEQSRCFLHPVGAVSMGYGIP